MKKKRGQISGLPRVLIVGLLGAFIGYLFAAAFDPFPNHIAWSKTILPDDYRIPKIPGGTALRLAMVHDILNERYLRHGLAWYRRRNDDAAKILATNSATQPDQEKYFDAMDDIAVGLQQLGKGDQAIALMREKLTMLPPLPALQPKPTTRPDDFNAEEDDLNRMLAARNLTPIQHNQYTACANLGTILLVNCMGKAMAGDKFAKTQMQESLDLIEHALAINPAGHFGRETWQAILIEDLLAAIDHPDLLGKFDAFGDSLSHFYLEGTGNGGRRYLRGSPPPTSDAQISASDQLMIRGTITETCIDRDWRDVVNPDYAYPMPFDEPTMAIVGMWTMGGGPNPHFALTLGCIMEQVGQRSIAWNAYERAVELQDSFWPDTAIRNDMVKFCRDRQDEIATQESPGASDDWQNKIRKQHQDELAWGMAYQKTYQDYESKQIAAGVSINDPTFYTGFFQGRPPIASNPGLADDLIVSKKDAASMLPCLLLGLGLGMALALVLPEKHLS